MAPKKKVVDIEVRASGSGKRRVYEAECPVCGRAFTGAMETTVLSSVKRHLGEEHTPGKRRRKKSRQEKQSKYRQQRKDSSESVASPRSSISDKGFQARASGSSEDLIWIATCDLCQARYESTSEKSARYMARRHLVEEHGRPPCQKRMMTTIILIRTRMMTMGVMDFKKVSFH